MTVIRRGFYYTIKISGESVSNFLMYHIKKQRSYLLQSSNIFVRIQLKTTKEGSTYGVNISDYGTVSNYGGIVINQVADFLDKEGLILFLDDNRNGIFSLRFVRSPHLPICIFL